MIHHVFANRSNTGDWLSARGIQKLLAPLPVEEHLCDGPFVDATIAALARATPDDLVVIGGGGLFMDYFEPFWRAFAALDVRYCVWGAGACDMKREPSRMDARLLAEVAERALACVVRDDLTRDLAPTVDLPGPVPCPSVVAVAGRRRRGHDLLHPNNYDNVGEAWYERVGTLLRDEAEARGVRYRETSNRIEPGRTDELEANLGLYEASELVVASALHGCILGLALGCRVLAVSGDHKIESFMAAAGLGEWVLDLEDGDELAARFAALPEQPDVSDFITGAVAANAQVAEQVRALATVPG